ncbi:hypothetical protein JR316_0010705 [Psilocybe cubensis]|uniref:Uncharacterized protein n=2 Tax=Psilocybe cubensis TaxID=181762 RepID=A0ACB8GMV7_PSICU|nr:hypothetical protein JR316_0010705 [Psilocybe cubensis]KAH9476790.1 hypothetical protein JR316_0010705 [Psilocybe cubensis]
MFRLTIILTCLAALLQTSMVASAPIPDESTGETDAILPGYGDHFYGDFGGRIRYPQLKGGIEHTGLANLADNVGDALASVGAGLGGLL